jgi:transcriptional regulator with XRE-family HTH domain
VNQRRITMAEIAEKVGVSRMAVSMALRGHHRISLQLRRRVQRVARELGYVPDPFLSALAAHRRQRVPAKDHGVLAWLNHWKDPRRLRQFKEFDLYWTGASREAVAAGMFGRWSQEDFLKYRREHYALDRLVSYQVSQMDETTTVVNPAWRKLVVKLIPPSSPARTGGPALRALSEPSLARVPVAAQPDVLSQFFQQLVGKIRQLGYREILFHLRDAPHPRNHRAHRGICQGEFDRGLSRCVTTPFKIGFDFVHPSHRARQTVSAEIPAAKIAFGKVGFGG